MHRFLLAECLIVALAVGITATPQEAQGQMGGAGGGSAATSVVASDFFMRLMRKTEDDTWTIFTDFDRRVYFNQARCTCGETIRLELDLSDTGAAKRNALTTNQANVEVLIGQIGCVAGDPASLLNAKCRVLQRTRLADLARTRQRTNIDFPVAFLYGPDGNDCSGQGQQAIRLRIDFDRDGIPDLVGEAAPFLPIDYDGEPPEPPSNIKVEPGNEALSVSWETNQGVADFRGFVVFCSRGEDFAVYNPTLFDNQYSTTANTCNKLAAPAMAQQTAALLPPPREQTETSAAAVQAQTSDADGGSRAATGPWAAPKHFVELDPRFVCSELLVTQTSTRLKGLQNGIPYLVGVSTIDIHGNPSPITSVLLQTPIATRDFYKGYRLEGGDAEGGYCAWGGQRRSSGLLGLFAAALGLLGARQLARRRK